ncbi:MAG: D-sedoheptulose-7-phosphate isomerase [Bacillota bacterium]
MKQNLEKYLKRVSSNLIESPFSRLERTAEILLKARENNRWIYLAGNGGSASTASHFANDLVKGLSVTDKPRFKAQALGDSLPTITALANDIDYSEIYREQLKNFVSRGDVFIPISGSGNSENVVKAAAYAREQKATVISFTGRDGGKLKKHSDICCIAPSEVMEEIEDIHMVWEHALITVLRNKIIEEGEN